MMPRQCCCCCCRWSGLFQQKEDKQIAQHQTAVSICQNHNDCVTGDAPGYRVHWVCVCLCLRINRTLGKPGHTSSLRMLSGKVESHANCEQHSFPVNRKQAAVSSSSKLSTHLPRTEWCESCQEEKGTVAEDLTKTILIESELGSCCWCCCWGHDAVKKRDGQKCSVE